VNYVNVLIWSPTQLDFPFYDLLWFFGTASEGTLTGFEKFRRWYKPDRFIHWGLRNPPPPPAPGVSPGEWAWGCRRTDLFFFLFYHITYFWFFILILSLLLSLPRFLIEVLKGDRHHPEGQTTPWLELVWRECGCGCH
jgi:hypothetical protein